MKQLERPAAPGCFATDTAERLQAHRARYGNVHYPSGGWRALWNDLDKDETRVAAPRRALLAMSRSECAYCGFLVGNDFMVVDHILPKEAFPLVAYAWDNLLPACGPCNGRKLAFVPASLQGKKLVEPCLRETVEHDLVFDKPHLFSNVAREDRLLDPSFDEPGEHIELLLDTASYRPKSALGARTHDRLLRRREIAERLSKVRNAARVVVEVDLSPQQFEEIAIATSYPSLFHRFADYWRTEQREGRLALWQRAEAPGAPTPAAGSTDA